MSKLKLSFLFVVLIAATVFAVVALKGTAPAFGDVNGCPSSNAIGNFLTSNEVGASFTIDGSGNTVTYTFASFVDENPADGVPGLVEYCVYPGAQPDSITSEAVGDNGGAWTDPATFDNFSFQRPDGNPGNIGLDGTSTEMGTATWNSGAPTSQTILLHINDADECDALYGGNPGTCFVFPGGGGGPLGITTEIHIDDVHVGVTEAKAGDVIHDSATITGSIPAGSKVHTDLFRGMDCTGTPIAAGSGDSPAAAAVDPSTPAYTVTPGDASEGLSYQAQLLDSSGNVLPADTSCEPLSVEAEAEPPTVSKDADGSYDDTFDWTITKSVDKTIVKQFGGTATFNYTVSVSHGDSQVSNVKVTGTITVANPNSADVTLDGITDELDSTTCSVDTSGGLTVGPGDTTFSYECDLDDSLPLIEVYNKVTVTWSEQTLSDGSHLAAGSADFTTDPVSFTANEIDECLDVSDPIDSNSPHHYCVGDPGDPTFSFTYSRTVPVPQWDCQSYTNTATFTTNDTGETGSASQTVTVCGPAKTGALTMGFWQNKNGQAIITGGASTGGVCNSGTWLRQYNPFKDLSATATCSKVATYVYNIVKAANARGASMNAMLKAQMLATALDVYFSDPALGGNRINAPAPIGGVNIDVTLICTNLTCTAFEDASSVFPSNSGGKESASQLLTDASNASNSGGSLWYGNVKSTQELAKDTFDALNNQKVFDP